MRLAVLGASARSVCGVRDCARALEPALVRAGVEVETAWWERGRVDADAWGRSASAVVRRADAVLWHYSVFAYALRGVPVLLGPALRATARPRPPVLGFLHELAHHWAGGPRAAAFAAAQRLALARVVGALDVSIVTSEERLAWLRSRRWLPRRRAAFIPLVSNVPVVATGEAPEDGAFRVGVFGFGREGRPPEAVVLGAIAGLRARGLDARLELLGAPGPESPEAARWLDAATGAGCRASLAFSGVVAPDELSRRLAALDALVFADDCGPTPRRGTLAASLAHGRAVVSFSGTQQWRRLVDDGAVVVSDREPGALAEALHRLARDPAARAEQGARARRFYAEVMADDHAAARILDLVGEATS